VNGGITPPFLNASSDAGDYSVLRPCRFTIGADFMEGWMGPTVGLDAMKKRIIFSHSQCSGNKSNWKIFT
jgi:hypothetical protein